MSKASKQSRQDQYRPIKGQTPPRRPAPGLSPGQPVGSNSSASRGKQGNG